MRVVGIVAEYNPFHSGHAYHLAQAKALTQSDFALVVMSGDFVQRGEPAMFSKHLRTKWALAQGADLVIGLPTVCSLTSAAGFARGAIALLDGLQVVDTLCFGSELGDVSLLQQALDAADTPAYAQALTASLKQGGSYPAARDAALRAAQGVTPGPNDILGLEYLRALSLCHSAITPYALRREGAGHDQDGLFGPHASATALRGCIQAGDLESLAPYLSPQVRSDMVAQLAQGDIRTFSQLSPVLLYALRRLSKAQLADLGEVREGLENPLYRACREAATMEELLTLVKTRRYPMARLKRACLCAALGITRADLEQLPQGLYCRVLGLRRQAMPLLARLCQASRLPVICRYADAQGLTPAQVRFFQLDRFAAEIAPLAARQPQPAPFDFGQPLQILD